MGEKAPRKLKRLGQVFLNSPLAMGAVVDSLDLEGNEVVLEIGAGDGRISRLIAPRVKKLLANELDERFVEVLRKRLVKFPNAHVVPGDILSEEVIAMARQAHPSGRFLVYGSIPYYISSPILRWIAAHADIVERASLLIQREVARRVSAKPGTKEYGFLTVLMQRRAEVSLGPVIKRGAFRPVPKVDSQVIHLRPFRTLDLVKEEKVEKLVSSLFQHRRKQLRSTLRSLVGAGHLHTLAEKVGPSGISLSDRPERLMPRDFETVLIAMDELFGNEWIEKAGS